MEKSNISVILPIIERVKRHLGEPVRKIELDETQFETAYDDAISTFEMYHKLAINDYGNIKEVWIGKYTLANCKEILGRVRGKFKGKVGGEYGELVMDYESLLNEARTEKNNLILLLK